MSPALYAFALYSGLLGLIAAALFANVGKRKTKAKIFMGDGGDLSVIRAMRGQMNFVENVPMILILLLAAVLLGMPVIAIHIGGGLLVIGRFFHALHFIQDDAPGWQRMIGAMFTFLVLVASSLALISHAVFALF